MQWASATMYQSGETCAAVAKYAWKCLAAHIRLSRRLFLDNVTQFGCCWREAALG